MSGLLKNNKATGKTNTTYDVESEDELSEGRLSSDNDVMERVNAKIEKFEAEKDVPEMKDDTVELLSGLLKIDFILLVYSNI